MTDKFKRLFERLRIDRKVVIHRDDLQYDKIESYDVLIISNPHIDFTNEDSEAMRKFLQEGKSLALFGSGNEEKLQTLPNLNKFLSEYGIQFEKDTVVRTSFYKYLHPKHVLIDDGILHPLFDNFKFPNDHQSKSYSETYDLDTDSDEDYFNEGQLVFVYPNGSTLEVIPPSLPILSSGAISFPVKRPIGAVWDASTTNSFHGKNRDGKILVLGSSEMFSNDWIDKENNGTILETMIHFLLNNEKAKFDRSKSTKDNRIDEAKTVPDIEALSERLRSCLERHEPLPQDISSSLYGDMLSFSTDLIPDVIDMYSTLKVPKEPLTLIPPEFEVPIPPLRPAVFHAKLKELPAPPLEKFDLDEEFADNEVRLAQLTNTCTDDDCEYFIQEAGSLTSLVDETEGNLDCKEILHRLFQTVCFGYNTNIFIHECLFWSYIRYSHNFFIDNL